MTDTAPSVVPLAHEVHGPDGAPWLVLLAGLGAQRGWWPTAFVGRLAGDHRVVLPDNRDVGRSPWLDDLPTLEDGVAAYGRGERPAPPYTLADMAGDVIALLDDLGASEAHVVGASMGGMIAQHLAFGWPDRVLSLTSIMSTTGAPDIPSGDPEVLASLTAVAPMDSEEAFVAFGVEAAYASSGRSPVFDRADAARKNRAYWAGGLSPDGPGRHLLAAMADGDRTERLGRITAPTLVVHGAIDPMINVEGGRATARAIPGATYLELPDVGHELPGAVHVVVSAAISALAAPSA